MQINTDRYQKVNGQLPSGIKVWDFIVTLNDGSSFGWCSGGSFPYSAAVKLLRAETHDVKNVYLLRGI